ncbi:MAG: 6,7-dimethyl-8-ribityllumazine synthase [Candidatus Anoxymicrobium japonicum]|uniref:6,7-dimethyl-8-ribityllumazine synthase n=1 Tax=Candidatus Anoxymicrobium japonicum TaxID=2013648 RepID=A0A2N3G670_9ACTN|nr:MAG: 6,7-dimethyl-8-ribityllumazine synthase [Candidatus Anoxymicrobium japonicum]
MSIFEGQLIAREYKFAIVVSRFNEIISKNLLSGAKDSLRRHEAADENVDIAWVPGAFEIPIVASRMASCGKYNAVICLGAVIRGNTPHFDYVAAQVSKGIARIGLDTGVPVAFGIITADTLEQALERAGAKAGNKGWQAAQTAIEMADLMSSITG